MDSSSKIDKKNLLEIALKEPVKKMESIIYQPRKLRSRNKSRILERLKIESNVEREISESEEFLLRDNRRKKNKSKQSKKISKKKVIRAFPSIEKLRTCTSKRGLRKLLKSLNPYWRIIIKFYMTECFIFDLFSRRLENKMFLLSKRDFLYSLIDNPDLLASDCHFDNNLLKNYCTGVANFIYKHYDMIRKEVSLRKTS